MNETNDPTSALQHIRLASRCECPDLEFSSRTFHHRAVTTLKPRPTRSCMDAAGGRRVSGAQKLCVVIACAHFPRSSATKHRTSLSGHLPHLMLDSKRAQRARAAGNCTQRPFPVLPIHPRRMQEGYATRCSLATCTLHNSVLRVERDR